MAQKAKAAPTADWDLYEQGIDYNHRLSPDYYATVNRNWRVYNLNHWLGIDTNGLPTFILPLTQRIIRHFVASLMTNSVKMQFTVENISDATTDMGEQERLKTAEFLSKNSRDRWEQLKMDSLIRQLLLDGAMSGDFCIHTYWDATVDTGQTSGTQPVLDDDGMPVLDEFGYPQLEPVPIMGEFLSEAVDGVNVMLGNPNDPRVNFNGRPYQPYIIVSGREIVKKLRKEAKDHKKENGLTDSDIKALIVPDVEYTEQAGDRGSKELENTDSEYGKATYVIKYWVDDDGKILFNKTVKNCYIRKSVDSELTLYPIAWGNWDTVKNSYHGQAVMTGLTDNQLQIDKAFAKLFKYLSDMAFPKIAYNKNLMPNGLTNKLGAIPVNASDTQPLSNIIYPIPPAQIANRVIDIITIAISKTMELLGVSDAFLGNANPENTSALVAMSKNSSIPLENVRSNLKQLIEDLGYIWLDFQLHKYKVPRNIAVTENGQRQMVLFDPSTVTKAKFRITVDVMDASYMSEFSQTRTLENLLQAGLIDVVQFIKRLPDNTVPEREKLLMELEQRLAQQEAMQTQEYKNKVIQEFIQGAQQQQAQQPAQ